MQRNDIEYGYVKLNEQLTKNSIDKMKSSDMKHFNSADFHEINYNLFIKFLAVWAHKEYGEETKHYEDDASANILIKIIPILLNSHERSKNVFKCFKEMNENENLFNDNNNNNNKQQRGLCVNKCLMHNLTHDDYEYHLSSLKYNRMKRNSELMDDIGLDLFVYIDNKLNGYVDDDSLSLKISIKFVFMSTIGLVTWNIYLEKYEERELMKVILKILTLNINENKLKFF